MSTPEPRGGSPETMRERLGKKAERSRAQKSIDSWDGEARWWLEAIADEIEAANLKCLEPSDYGIGYDGGVEDVLSRLRTEASR